MHGLYPRPFDELKIKWLKFFTSCWVQCKVTRETSGLDRLKCLACSPGHSRIKNEIVDVLYLLLSSAQSCRGGKWITSLNKPSFCTGAIQQIKNKNVEVLYLLLSSAQNHRADKCITSLHMPGMYPGPFDEWKIKLLKFFTSSWVRHKNTEETSALHRLTCQASAPGHSINEKWNCWCSLPPAEFGTKSHGWQVHYIV